MKIGSIVECVESVFTLEPNCFNIIKGKRYTVRNIVQNLEKKGRLVVYLEEIKNTIHPLYKKEWGYGIEKFREVEFPPSLEQQIKESLTRELQTV